MNPSKFFIAAAAALLLSGTQSVAAKPFAGSLGGLNTLLDFRVEVDAANECDAAAYSDGSVTKGLASVFPSFLKKIEKEMGHGTVHPTALMEAAHQVQTKRFTETTQLHRDTYLNEQGLRQGVGESDNGMVGFIFRNTNEDAHFETDADGDGGFCFPAVEGTFMSFDGSIPHQTIVKSGHVELIGPFLLSSKALFRVEVPCPTCCAAEGTKEGDFCRANCPLTPSCGGGGGKTGKTSRSPTTAKSSKTGSRINEITTQQLESIQKANKTSFSFLIAGTMIVAAAAILNIALKWAQKSRQARSIDDLDEEEAVDGFEDEFEDESNEQLRRDVIVGEGVEIVETNY
jgi:hypothetical protein